MRNSKMAVPRAIPYDMEEHGQRPADAMLLVTRTEHIPLVFGSGEETPGQMIDRLLSEGHCTKIALDLDKDNW